MNIYATSSEAFPIVRLKINISFKDAVEQLNKNRQKDLDWSRPAPLGDCISELCGEIVHSVFFVNDNKTVFNIWDASLSGFRPKECFENMKISW